MKVYYYSGSLVLSHEKLPPLGSSVDLTALSEEHSDRGGQASRVVGVQVQRDFRNCLLLPVFPLGCTIQSISLFSVHTSVPLCPQVHMKPSGYSLTLTGAEFISLYRISSFATRALAFYFLFFMSVRYFTGPR